MTLEIYTDGGSKRGAGAWAWVAADRKNGKVSELYTVSMLEIGGHSLEMEMLAVIDACRHSRLKLEHPAVIVCDCAYVVNSLRHGWPQQWRKQGWRNAKGKPSAHKPLWEQLLHVLEIPGAGIRFQYVRGHGRGDELTNGPYRQGNAWADRACRSRIDEYLRMQIT